MDIHNDEAIKMYFYENRLKTFEGWPFDEDCACNAENVSGYAADDRWTIELVQPVVSQLAHPVQFSSCNSSIFQILL